MWIVQAKFGKLYKVGNNHGYEDFSCVRFVHVFTFVTCSGCDF